MNARYKPRQVAQLETEFVCALIALDRYDELPVLEQEELIVTHRVSDRDGRASRDRRRRRG